MDHSGAVLNFISQILLEEEDDLRNAPSMLHNSLALQATEKSLYDILHNNTATDSHDDNSNKQHRKHSRNDNDDDQTIRGKCSVPDREEEEEEDDGFDSEPLPMYDDELICSRSAIQNWEKSSHQRLRPGRGRPPKTAATETLHEEQAVDLNALLQRCAGAVAVRDTRAASDLLIRIRQHSSPRGGPAERVAHHFAVGLDARLAGEGTELYAASSANRIYAAEMLRAYKALIHAAPFRRVSNMLANKTVWRAAVEARAKKLHVIDFGILYGFQWPCLIHILSTMAGGPLKLRLTGIDFPQPGFRPAERVAQSGVRLAKYCRRFGVPFEYNAIARKWETITVEDLKIEEGELLVVNTLYRFKNVPNESSSVMTVSSSPRDTVLSLINKINPDLFILGVTNGTLDSPFFVTRFREALFQYSCLFDMLDATMKREDEDRLFLEGHLYRMEALNIVACEGTQRVERPETYKQWHARTKRAGLRQLPFYEEDLKYIMSKVKEDYHRDFSLAEDGKWFLQGWKGRVLYAMSIWKPANK